MRKSKPVARSKSRKARAPGPTKLVTGSRLSNYKLKRIIECYARQNVVRSAAQTTLVSHVTVGRIYMLIRQRLLDTGIYQSIEAYKIVQYDIENDESEGYRFYEQAFDQELSTMLGQYRGIDAHNRHLYEAEALFRYRYPETKSHELVGYVLSAIKAEGPLGGEQQKGPPQTFVADSEWVRRQAINLRKIARGAYNQREGLSEDERTLRPAAMSHMLDMIDAYERMMVGLKHAKRGANASSEDQDN